MEHSTENIESLVAPTVEALGCRIWGVELQGGWKNNLKVVVYIDAEDGISVDDCATVSEHVSDILDMEELVPSPYVLEVSSGGLARPLTIIDDYEAFKYNKAKIVLKEKFLGKKTYKGFLKGIDKNGKILLETDNHKIKFNFLEIEKANIDPNWAIENN